MNKIQNVFTDEYFNVHTRGKLLGQGGQGVVFRTKDPDIAIKLVTDENGDPVTDRALISRFSNRLKNVRLLPLPNDLNLSVPSALLKDKVGYVMQLLSDMVPFSSFWLDGKTAEQIKSANIPEWLGEMSEDDAKKLVHYCKTGGLRRRLIALYKCSAILARLHGNGFVYGDISPANAYLSKDLSLSEVWFIDADNLRFEIASGGSGVYTPKYGAPELVQELDGGRPGTDCHAFAVMAFHILSMIHPFVGDLVEGGGENDWANDDFDEEDLEEKAYAGHLPWVDDCDDDSNSTSSGLPRQLVLTEKLAALFQRTFRNGRTSFWKRPAIYHWPEALAEAADKTIVCLSCYMSWFIDIEGENCPYCDSSKPSIIFFESYRWTGEKELASPCWSYAHELSISEEPLILPERIFKPFSMSDSDNSILKLFFNEQNILITKSEACNINISVALPNENGGGFRSFVSKLQLPVSVIKTGFWLYADGDEPRIIKCSIIGDPK